MSDFQIPFLSSLVGLLAEVMRVCLEFCYKMTEDLGFPSYGIAIIVLTVIIKTLLLPLALKQIRSMKAMQAIQPEMQKIQKKYKNDPQKLREEMGKLYKENGASPLSGCLPLLIQMPFLISIYYALQGFSYDPAHESFLWLESLAVPDETYILPNLSAASSFIHVLAVSVALFSLSHFHCVLSKNQTKRICVSISKASFLYCDCELLNPFQINGLSHLAL